jgi:hypothetical protein
VWDDEYDPAQVEACRRALEAHADLTQYSTERAAAGCDVPSEISAAEGGLGGRPAQARRPICLGDWGMAILQCQKELPLRQRP